MSFFMCAQDAIYTVDWILQSSHQSMLTTYTLQCSCYIILKRCKVDIPTLSSSAHKVLLLSESS